METEKVAEGAAAAAEEIVVEAASTAMQLKPIHIIVMVITLLHAVAIGMWFLVYMGGTKGGSRAAGPAAAASASGGEGAGASSSDAGKTDGKGEDKKTQ